MSREQNWKPVGELKDHPEGWADLRLFQDLHFAPDGWMWCLHCERAYPTARVIVLAGPGSSGEHEIMLACPVDNCDGSPLDWSPWDRSHWPRNENPEYPETPEAFGHYPLYGSAP